LREEGGGLTPEIKILRQGSKKDRRQDWKGRVDAVLYDPRKKNRLDNLAEGGEKISGGGGSMRHRKDLSPKKGGKKGDREKPAFTTREITIGRKARLGIFLASLKEKVKRI